MLKIATEKEAHELSLFGTYDASRGLTVKRTDALAVYCTEPYHPNRLVSLDKLLVVNKLQITISGRQIRVNSRYPVTSKLTIVLFVDNKFDKTVTISIGNSQSTIATSTSTKPTADIASVNPQMDATYFYK